MILAIIAAICIVWLFISYHQEKRLSKSTVMLTAIAIVALVIGGIEWSMEMKVVRENGGQLSLLGEMSIPLTAIPDDVVTYATKNNQDLTLSVYRNPDKYRGQKQPIYVYIHGGGWSHGDSESLSGLHREVANQGYVVFSINYRLATENYPTWKVATDDIAEAMNWVKDHAAEYGGDIEKFILSGESAGGHLDLLYTGLVSSGKLIAPLPNVVIAMYPAVDLQWISNNARYLTLDTIPGFVETYIGGNLTDNKDRVQAIDPLSYISEKFPPVYLIHGEEDTMVNIKGSEDFVEKLSKLGVKSKLIRFPFANHGINFQVFVSLMNYYAEQEGLGVAKP